MTESSNFEDMSEYLQTFLDETEEQLDDLVETILSLEQSKDNADDLNEAFRLIHSIKGAAGMMGLDQITVLTHHLETRFERFRSGTQAIDEPTMSLVLRSIDFFRQCNDRLRAGESLVNPNELLEEIKRLEDQPASELAPIANDDDHAASEVIEADASERPPTSSPDSEGARLRVRFRDGLMLADLKARLIVNRLSALGTITATRPDLATLSEDAVLVEFEVHLETASSAGKLRDAAGVEGVESIEMIGIEEDTSPPQEPKREVDDEATESSESAHTSEPDSTPEPAIETKVEETEPDSEAPSEPEPEDAGPEPDVAIGDSPRPDTHHEVAAIVEPEISEPKPTPPTAESPTTQEKATSKLSETMRVDISRLDHLMNLAGELVVNRARFVQISEQIAPAHRESGSATRLQEFADKLRTTLRQIDGPQAASSDLASLAGQLREGIDAIDQHSQIWDQDRKHLERFDEAINQLSRVSQGLQKGVLDTRMVPVGPLFNRFRRVVRDLSKERGKQVELKIRGEKTELDKRMIDELGDPLMHLIRNAVDHGMESPETRVTAGKSSSGTILLEATHSENNVFISIRDDGAGIDHQKIRDKLVAKRLLSASAVSELNDDQVLDYIWHPGFSTAQEVTNISGRGVGMDVVRDRIRQLNGSVEVESAASVGTTFTIRLPLTLAIIHCLLVRMRGVVFAMPIADVREIVSIRSDDVITVSGKKAFEVRDEFLPLVQIDDVFQWSQSEALDRETISISETNKTDHQVVILQTAGKKMGMCVDEFLGSQDMVIKSLSDNFVDIRGLSGASIMGDGSVCLMLDVGTMFHLVVQRSLSSAS